MLWLQKLNPKPLQYVADNGSDYMPRMIQQFAERDGTTVLVSQPEPGCAADPADAIHGLGEQQLFCRSQP